MDKKKALGQRIKELRKSKKISQEHLAELVNLEPPSICNIENGKNYPTLQNLEKISDVLDVSFVDIFNFSHFTDDSNLINEIDLLLKSNPEKVKLIYKLVKVLVE